MAQTVISSSVVWGIGLSCSYETLAKVNSTETYGTFKHVLPTCGHHGEEMS